MRLDVVHAQTLCRLRHQNFGQNVQAVRADFHILQQIDMSSCFPVNQHVHMHEQQQQPMHSL